MPFNALPFSAQPIGTRFRSAIAWVLLLGYAAAVVAAAGEPSPYAQGLAAIGIAVALAHAVLAFGFVGAFALLGTCLVVTFAIENLGIATGFPFGHYHFEVAAALPYVGAVPIIVGPLYFAVGYFSWCIACLLVGSDRPRGWHRYGLPIIAAFVMVQWDVVMDPPNATLGRAWIWHDGGGYFGVPLSNFFGWYATVWLFFQIFSLMAHSRGAPWLARARGRSRGFSAVPILLYLSMALSLIVPHFIIAPGPAVVVAGTVWHPEDLRETSAIVALFTMVPSAVLALMRLIDREAASQTI